MLVHRSSLVLTLVHPRLPAPSSCAPRMLGWSLLLLGAFSSGCGGGQGGTGGAPGAGAVTATAIDSYEGSQGTTKVPVGAGTWSSIAALVTENGEAATLPGTLDAKGDARISGVPEGSYQLALSSPGMVQVHETSARTLDLGTVRSYRDGLVPMTMPSIATVSAPLTLPWQTGMMLEDILAVFSRNTAALGTFGGFDPPAESPPADGATALSGWQIDLSKAVTVGPKSASLYQADRGDDLVLLHEVAVQVSEPGRTDGWSSYQFSAVREAFSPPPFTLADGGQVTLSGSFTPTPPKTFSLRYQSAGFTQALAGAPAPPAQAFVSLTLMNEPGAPDPAVGGDAFLLQFGVGGPLGDYTHDFTYGNPFTYGQELVQVDLSFSAQVLFPDMTMQPLSADVGLLVPAAEASGAPLAAEVGVPRAVTVSGKALPLDALTSGVGTTPAIAFQPPALGTPTFYEVSVFEIGTPTRGVGFFSISGTSLTLPAGTVVTGKSYYLHVTAVSDPVHDPAKPFVGGAHVAYGQTFTGVFSP